MAIRGMHIPGWNTIETAPVGEIVMTKIHDDDGERNVAEMRRWGNLWFIPGPNSMYVYYTPTHWKPLAERHQRLCAGRVK